jgi:hypothetical protein
VSASVADRGGNVTHSADLLAALRQMNPFEAKREHLQAEAPSLAQARRDESGWILVTASHHEEGISCARLLQKHCTSAYSVHLRRPDLHLQPNHDEKVNPSGQPTKPIPSKLQPK